jgi:hypothetical protein
MNRRLTVALVAIASLLVSALFAGSAMAQAPEAAKVKMIGRFKVEINKHISDTQRFHKKKRRVQTGGTLTIVNKAKTPDPHTFSLLNKEARPDNVDELFACEACDALLAQHDTNGDQEPDALNVNTGLPGLDEPGDSQFIGPPETPGDQATLDVSAPAGTRLFAICLVHPWMQMKVVVTEQA